MTSRAAQLVRSPWAWIAVGTILRLAHILFGGNKVVEVATFRRNPAMEAPEEEASEVFDDLLIRSDNVGPRTFRRLLLRLVRAATLRVLEKDARGMPGLSWIMMVEDG